MTEVKICGLRDASMVRVASESGADWIGFVLFEKSPRNILVKGEDPLEELRNLSEFASELGLRTAALMVNPGEGLINEVLDDTVIDALQLHGAESPSFVERVWRDADGRAEIWKALPVGEDFDEETLEDWAVDRFLFDKPPARADQLTGGNGEAFDWDILQSVEIPRPWFLAGGLTVDTVADAIAATGAPAVDVSSGVERMRGVKDEQLIRAFIDQAKSV